MGKVTAEQEAFKGFKFQLGQIVTHVVTGVPGIVTNRILVQAPTGNTGHMYEIASGERYNRRFEIELTEASLT